MAHALEVGLVQLAPSLRLHSSRIQLAVQLGDPQLLRQRPLLRLRHPRLPPPRGPPRQREDHPQAPPRQRLRQAPPPLPPPARAGPPPHRGPAADRQRLDLSPRRFRTAFGGLFLFLPLQRRTKKLLRTLRARPAQDWRTIQLHNIGRQYRTPRVLEEWVRLGRYPKKVGRLAVAGLGREALLLLVTNQKRGGAAALVDRYARRMLIENQIADAIRFFHTDALSSAVPLRVEVDLQATLMAGGLYRLMATQVGCGYQQARAQTLFRKFGEAVVRVTIEEQRIVVRFSRRANNPYLIEAGFGDSEQPTPWLGNKALRLEFG